MNDEVINIIKIHNLHPIGYQKNGKVYIIKEKKDSFVIKVNTNNYDIYKYLMSRNFPCFPENYSLKNNNYDIYKYIDDFNVSKIQKIEDLIVILALLHKKTMYIREISLDEIKSIYEELNKKIDETRNYYLKINDIIDQEEFINPSHYLLIRNISLFYSMLNYSKNTLNNWYDKIKSAKSIRVVLLHNNIDINHLIINENKYLISWDKAYFDNPIYDIEMFYHKYYQDIELIDTLYLYEKNNKLNDLEKNLLIIRLSIPRIISFTLNTMDDTIAINNEIIYLQKVMNFIEKTINEKLS